MIYLSKYYVVIILSCALETKICFEFMCWYKYFSKSITIYICIIQNAWADFICSKGSTKVVQIDEILLNNSYIFSIFTHNETLSNLMLVKCCKRYPTNCLLKVLFLHFDRKNKFLCCRARSAGICISTPDYKKISWRDKET